MSTKKYAFIVMGEQYNPGEHKAIWQTSLVDTYMLTVKNPEQARQVVTQLVHDKIGAIELCGAFPTQLVDEIIEICGDSISVGVVTHSPEQLKKALKFWGFED